VSLWACRFSFVWIIVSLNWDREEMQAEQQIGLPDNIAVFLNVRSLVDFENAQIVPGHFARRATDDEINKIRTGLNRLAGEYRRHVVSLWEWRWDDNHTQTVRLERNEWRYFVIAFRGDNGTVNDLSLASNISTLGPDIGPILMYGEWNSFLHNPVSFFQSTEHTSQKGESAFVDLTLDGLQELSSIWSKLTADRENPVWQTVNQLHHLKGLPAYSAMKFLGYFAVLESLLTHMPDPSDPYDAITRQVKKKMTLLNNRFDRPLDYAAFGNTPPETIWAKLYRYRSLIAHGVIGRGNQQKFEGELAALRGHDMAFDLVSAAVKAVARQSLLEPKLLTDLRDC